jgi:hypothetical protein
MTATERGDRMTTMTIDPGILQQLQRDGAAARALGASFLDCPLYRSDGVPAATGDPIEVWNSKVAAWQLGWKLEHAMRTA